MILPGLSGTIDRCGDKTQLYHQFTRCKATTATAAALWRCPGAAGSSAPWVLKISGKQRRGNRQSGLGLRLDGSENEKMRRLAAVRASFVSQPDGTASHRHARWRNAFFAAPIVATLSADLQNA